VPDATIALKDRERTLGIKTYGHSDLAIGAPVDEDILFEIGSIGKSFTAIALLGHVAGGPDLQAPVANYLPWFEVPSRPSNAPNGLAECEARMGTLN